MKKIISLLLIATMLASLLAGCGEELADPNASAPTLGIEPEKAEEKWEAPKIIISEVMSGNTAFLMTRNGVFPDWVELENTGKEAVDLSGWYLSDNEEKPDKWRIADLTLAPGERTVIYCAGEDAVKGEADFYISSAKGEVITLSDGEKRLVDSVILPPCDPNVSFVRQDGALEECVYPTPGYENTQAGYEDYCACLEAPAPGLIINEAVLYNLNYEPQDGELYDWVELKNTSDEVINLSGYTLCDNLEKVYRYELPSRNLTPGEKLVIFCSGDESNAFGSYLHAGFALSSGGEGVILLAPDGTVADYAAIVATPYGGSMGRSEGMGGMLRFDSPSPGEENGEGLLTISDTPDCSLPQGVYNDVTVMTAELTAPGVIYYSLDGSVPDRGSAVYSTPIEISANTVIRAVCEEEGKCLSEPVSFSYIVNENDSKAVVSLVCDPEGMYGAGGVYYGLRSVDPVIDGNISLFEPEGGGFSRNCTIQLHGARSREVFLKKSFKITFPSRLGGDLIYDVFGDGNITDFHSVLLRGGAILDLGLTLDNLAARVMEDVCPETYVLNTRYAVLYINGEYRGLYSVREAYSGEYFESHTGAKAEDVVISRSPVNVDELSTLLAKLSNMDMRDEDNYAYASEKLDLVSLIRWAAVEAYFTNLDLGGNIRYVKLSEDSPWQMVLFDLDHSVQQMMTDWGVSVYGYGIGPVITKLLKNESFRKLMLEVTAELYNNGFNTGNILRIYDDMNEEMDDLTVQKDLDRWTGDFSRWVTVRERVRGDLQIGREAWFLDQLQDLTGAGDEEMQQYFGDYPKVGY